MGALKTAGKLVGLYVLAYLVQVCFLIKDHVPFTLQQRLAQAKWWLLNPRSLMTMTEDEVMESYLSNTDPPQIEIPVIEGTWEEIKDEVMSLGKDWPRAPASAGGPVSRRAAGDDERDSIAAFLGSCS